MDERRRLRQLIAGALVGAAIALVVLWPRTQTAQRTASAGPESPPITATAPATPVPAAVLPPVAPTATDPQAAPRGPEVVFSAPWGEAAGQLGRRVPEAGAPEGPMSFIVGPEGRLWVLDQVNRRVQVFADGKVVKVIELPAVTYQDLALDTAGHLLLLDRLKAAELTVTDGQGKVLGEVPLVGAGVAAGGEVTALLTRDNGTWVESGHRRLVRLTDAAGRPDPDRPTLDGRPTAGGDALLTARLDRPCVVVLRQPMGPTAPPPQPLARPCFPPRLGHLVALESDREGRVYVVGHVVQTREVAPFDVVAAFDEVVALDASGAELGRLRLPSSGGDWEQFRSLSVAPDGSIYQLGLDEDGATMRRWRL